MRARTGALLVVALLVQTALSIFLQYEWAQSRDMALRAFAMARAWEMLAGELGTLVEKNIRTCGGNGA